MPTLLEEYKTRMLEDKTPTSSVIERMLPLWKVGDRNPEQERECDHLLGILHCRADEETIDAARKFLKSADLSERSLGAIILGQVKIGDESKAPLAAELLLGAINEESNSDVLRDLIFALGHTPELRALPKLLECLSHSSTDVRYALASTLPAYPAEQVVPSLITLMADSDLDVRDWATFGIGSLMDADSAEIRRALIDRLNDPEPDPRGEAMVGLATRGDPEVVPAFLKELGQEGLSAIKDWVLLNDTATESIRAAHQSGDSRWLPLLKKLKEIAFPSDQLHPAIAFCSAKPRQEP